MTQPQSNPGLLFSTFADDPDLGEIVEMFVDEMPDRVENLLRQFHEHQWDELQRLAHQLKGAAGSYGFEPLTPAAARLETALRDTECEQRVCEALEELVAMCQRVRSGSAR